MYNIFHTVFSFLFGMANYYSASTKKCEYARVASNFDLHVYAFCFPAYRVCINVCCSLYRRLKM